MKIVIDIPESTYNYILGESKHKGLDYFERVVVKGTPLEKVLEDIRSEIDKQYKWLQSTKRALYDVDVAFDVIRKAIDKHI